ncbi:MAG: methyltransferase domain-containing protein [Bacilli bacterium]|nr:methyltransferase domain-containing protein [Bacilli bacterium]
MNEEKLIEYYNKFNEDKRLTRRHGIVEYTTTMKYIHKYLKDKKDPKILDVGAGTGKYSINLYEEGYDITALELIKHNLMTLKTKNKHVRAVLGNATDLSSFNDKTFDMVLLFGPLYHLITKEEKIKALKEAKRVLKDDGIILISYYMNDYAIIKHGFMEQTIKDAIKNNQVDNNFKIIPKNDDLYSYVRLEDIDNLNKIVNLKRIEIISQEGLTDYIRPYINKLDRETFDLYIKYHLSVCDKKEMLATSSHILDILKKQG